MNKWDKRFLDLCDHISVWSKDPSKRVGAVIVNKKNIIVGIGYNGFPRGVSDNLKDYQDKDVKNKIVIHAEANAILNANASVEGCTLYTNFFTCHTCATLAIQSGIKRVVSYKPCVSSSWSESFAIANKIYKSANMEVMAYEGS